MTSFVVKRPVLSFCQRNRSSEAKNIHDFLRNDVTLTIFPRHVIGDAALIWSCRKGEKISVKSIDDKQEEVGKLICAIETKTLVLRYLCSSLMMMCTKDMESSQSSLYRRGGGRGQSDTENKDAWENIGGSTKATTVSLQLLSRKFRALLFFLWEKIGQRFYWLCLLSPLPQGQMAPFLPWWARTGGITGLHYLGIDLVRNTVYEIGREDKNKAAIINSRGLRTVYWLETP